MRIEVQFDSIEEMMGFAVNMVGGTTVAEAVKATKVNKVKAKKKTAPSESEESGNNAPADIKDEVPFEEEAKTFTLEEVRAALAKLTRSGKQKEVKELLKSFKANKLTEVKQEDYAALMEKAGAI